VYRLDEAQLRIFDLQSMLEFENRIFRDTYALCWTCLMLSGTSVDGALQHFISRVIHVFAGTRKRKEGDICSTKTQCKKYEP
jgi:hypothetical protein